MVRQAACNASTYRCGSSTLCCLPEDRSDSELEPSPSWELVSAHDTRSLIHLSTPVNMKVRFKIKNYLNLRDFCGRWRCDGHCSPNCDCRCSLGTHSPRRNLHMKRDMIRQRKAQKISTHTKIHGPCIEPKSNTVRTDTRVNAKTRGSHTRLGLRTLAMPYLQGFLRKSLTPPPGDGTGDTGGRCEAEGCHGRREDKDIFF